MIDETAIQKILSQFPKLKIGVAGDLMQDRYLFGDTARISPEAPIPVVHITEETTKPGGAGNVARNIAATGAAVTLFALVGDDAAGETLRSQLREENVDAKLQIVSNKPTIQKIRVISRHQQMLRLDRETPFLPEDNRPLTLSFEKAIAQYDAVILSDYHKGTLADPARYIAAARKVNKPILIDPKGSSFEPYRGATVLTPNRKEFEQVMGHCLDEDMLCQKGFEAIAQFDLGSLVITRGEQGATLLQKNAPPQHFPAIAKAVFDVTGAGDTFIALLALGIAANAPLSESVQIANLGASIVVGKLGAEIVHPYELQAALRTHQGQTQKILTPKEAKQMVTLARSRGEKIVMTNGCFDILHAGHVSYLTAAKALGDKLIVAINTDESIKRLKGEHRPVNALTERLAVLAGLASVDVLVSFSDDTPLNLIADLLPDVLVKGGDYKCIEEIVGHEVVTAAGGRVEILAYEDGLSTTNMIQKIRETEKH